MHEEFIPSLLVPSFSTCLVAIVRLLPSAKVPTLMLRHSQPTPTVHYIYTCTLLSKVTLTNGIL